MKVIPAAPAWNVTNLLSEEQQKMTGPILDPGTQASGWWVTEGDANARVYRSSEAFKWTPSSLKLTTTTTATVSIETRSSVNAARATKIQTRDAQTYRTFAWVRPTRFKQVVRIGIVWTDGTAETYTSTEYTLTDTRNWTLISHTGAASGDNVTIETRIEAESLIVDGGIAESLFIDDAVLLRYDEPVGGFLTLTWANFPKYLRALDGEQTDPTSPTIRFLQLIGHTADRISAANLAFDYISLEDQWYSPEYVGYDRCTLVDSTYYPTPDVAEERWLPWLAYVTGTTIVDRITNEQTSTTPWFELPGTWADISALASPTTWNTIEDLAPSTPEVSVGPSDSIRLRGTGLLAGTIEGIKRAARLSLKRDVVWDIRGTSTRSSNVLTVTLAENKSVTVGQTIILYDCSENECDGEYEVLSVDAASRSFTVAQTGDDMSTPMDVWTTNAIVNVTRDGQWGLIVGTDVDQTVSPDLVTAAVTPAKPAGCIVTHEYNA